MAADFKMIASTKAKYIDTSGSVNLSTTIQTITGALSAVFIAMYQSSSVSGWVRFFTFEDKITRERRAEQYIYSSKGDADNDNGGRFMGATNQNSKKYFTPAH